MSEKMAGFLAGIAIRILIRNLKKKKQHLEETAPPTLTKEQIDQYIVDKTIEEAYNQLEAAYDTAYNELVKREKQIKDPYIKAIIEKIKKRHELFRPDREMHPGWMLTAILLNEALKHGVKDREKIYQYILKTSWEYSKQIAQLLPTRKYRGKYHPRAEALRNPYDTLLQALQIIRDALEEKNLKDETLEKYRVFVRTFARQVVQELGEKRKTHHIAQNYADYIEEKIREAEKKTGITPFWHKTPEEILGAEKEKPLAPQLVAKILEERLPGAAYRLASLLHAYEQGSPLDPKDLERIIEATTAPHSPQGTQQYNLIYKIIDKLEEDTAKGRTPRKPTTIIEEIIREALHLKPYHNTQQILQEIVEGKRPAEAILLKTRLGLPGDKKRIAKTLLNFLRIAREIEEGKRNPYYEDVKSELATIARNLKTVEPRTPTKEYLQKINPQTLEHLHNQIHKEYTERAIQIGRESATRILERAVQIAKQVMEKHRGKPYYQLVAETAREIEETLKTQLGRQPTPEERQEARWAALAIQHLLQTLPIHVAETKEELGMAKALLTQGYNPQEYDAPLVLDTIGKMAQLEKYEEQERKGILELIRMGGQSAEVVKNVAWRTLKAHREEGRMEPREYIKSLMENIGSVSRVKR